MRFVTPREFSAARSCNKTAVLDLSKEQFPKVKASDNASMNSNLNDNFAVSVFQPVAKPWNSDLAEIQSSQTTAVASSFSPAIATGTGVYQPLEPLTGKKDTFPPRTHVIANFAITQQLMQQCFRPRLL